MAFWRLCYHIVWATKNREPFIQPEIEVRLYGYLVSKAAELDVYVHAINGWYDHVHLIVSIPPQRAVATVVKRLKGASAHYLNHDVRLDCHFAWQRGYGALSLGERQRPIAEAYVARQKEHHEGQTDNPWLERHAEIAEGPDETAVSAGAASSSLREGTAEYDIGGDLPF